MTAPTDSDAATDSSSVEPVDSRGREAAVETSASAASDHFPDYEALVEASGWNGLADWEKELFGYNDPAKYIKHLFDLSEGYSTAMEWARLDVLRTMADEWAAQYESLTVQHGSGQSKVRAAYRLGSSLLAQRADALEQYLRDAQAGPR